MRAVLAPLSALALSCLPHPLQAEASIRQEQVHFAKGSNQQQIKGHIAGEQIVDYLIHASAGQTLTITLDKSNPQTYFNVTPKGNNSAMFIGAIEEHCKRLLPDDGDYIVRVYLMRAAARRKENSDYKLHIALSGEPLQPLPGSSDALIADTRHHAAGSIACKLPYTAAPQQCEAAAIRRVGAGTATIEVSQGGNIVRRLLFVQGVPTASDATGPLQSNRNGDLNTILFDGGEEYRIPDALINGG